MQTTHIEVPSTILEPIPTQQPPIAPSLSWILLITALLIQLRQTLETSTELIEQADDLLESLIEMLKTIAQFFDR